MASFTPDLDPIENAWGNIERYLGSRTYKDIKSLRKFILDQWNNLDESYWMHQTESIINRVDICILRNGGLTGCLF